MPGSQARGLFQMPPVRLTNMYFLVRAGESECESLGVVNTNPVAKTSVANGLSEKGKKQAVRAAFDLKSIGACENNCWIWHSITQRAYQAAEIIAAVNGVTRSHIVPEYSFLGAHMKGRNWIPFPRFMPRIASPQISSLLPLTTRHQTKVSRMSLFV